MSQKNHQSTDPDLASTVSRDRRVAPRCEEALLCMGENRKMETKYYHERA